MMQYEFGSCVTEITLPCGWLCVCVGAARPSDTAMPGLCSDAELRRNDWPWIGESGIASICLGRTMCSRSISPPPGIRRAREIIGRPATFDRGSNQGRAGLIRCRPSTVNRTRRRRFSRLSTRRTTRRRLIAVLEISSEGVALLCRVDAYGCLQWRIARRLSPFDIVAEFLVFCRATL